MASSSTARGSSASSSSFFYSSGIRWEYEVFLSFRGEDTRNNFTDHLYTALNDRGIYTFRDDERLERGKEISSKLLEAIEGSRFSIIVLSKNYASSTWCLEELAKILECMATRKQKVFPVFYNVDPSDIRKQRRDFETAFHKHEEDYKDNLDKVQRWRSALTQVGNLSGWHLQESRSEAELIKLIVYTISKSLKPTFSKVAEDLVGIKYSLGKINDLLESGLDDVRFIGICGMGGIGKTTIARVLYDSFSSDYQLYQGSCFLPGVREVSSKKSVVHLQEKLLSDVLKEKLNGDVDIRRRLCHKRVFVVLDDVDHLEQLEKLAGEYNWFGSGSRIIITTRDKHVLISHGISSTSIYEVKGLKDDDALKLFHKKAFRQGQPTNDHVELSKQIVQYTNGLPLALKVLGSHLCGRTVKEWKSEWNRLQHVPRIEILKILRISYDGLEKDEKQIFLDIACFFRGKNKDRVEEILDSCDFDSVIGLKVLDDKSLITVSYNKLGMHDLLQQMGWEIVREKHRDDRSQWSRLWLFEDIYRALKENKGMQEVKGVKGIMLDESEHRIIHLNGRSFSGMINLRLLKIKNVDLSEDIEYLSNDLRFLKWPGYPLNSLPSNFEPWKLFELDLCHSQIEYLWKDTKAFEKLKTIKLSYSQNLIETPDFTMVPKLEMLDLEGCTRLCKVHESVGGLKRLSILNLKGCMNLESFPSNVSGLKLLKILKLQGFSKLDKLPQNLGEMECLEDLDVGGTAIRQIPESIRELSKLKILYLENCQWLQSLPELPPNLEILDLVGCTGLCKVHESVGGLKRLKILNLKRCKNLVSFPSNVSGLKLLKILNLQGFSKLEKLPQNLGGMEWLEDLDVGGTAIRQIPESIRELSELKILYLENCQWLQSLPELPPNLKMLDLKGCTGLCKVHDSVGGLKQLKILNLKGCKNLESFPSNVSGLKLLKILNLQGCSKLEKLPQNLGEMKFLEDLDVGGTAIRQLPSSIVQLTNLNTLSFRECEGQLPRSHPNFMCSLLSGLCSLKTLYLRDCGLLEALPNNIGSLHSLEELKLSNNNFFSLPESIRELSKLKILCLENCQWLRSLPELPPNTIFVGAKDCRSLKDVSGALRGGTSKNFSLHLFNCLKLLENQNQENSLAVILLKQYLQQWVNRFSHWFHIRLPGSEIPKWFSCRSDGDSVVIKLHPNWLNDEFMGIAICGVYAPDPADLNNDIKRMSFGMSIMGNNYSIVFDIPSFTAVESDHLWLTFVSRVMFEYDYSYQISEDDTSRPSSDDVSVSGSTYIFAWFKIEGAKKSKSRVTKCGIRLVYKQDIEDFQELPAAEGSTFHQNHNCSLAEDFSGCSSQFPSSASSSSSDSSGIQCEYGVFLSFRGEDTRNNFTHLYTALNDSGIDTYFRDDERLERGKEISSKLLEAIEITRFSIIFLSKNYAFSTRCLEELAKILECKATKKPVVFPVFYKVDPSDIRTQRGDFETAFRKHEEDYKDNLDKVHRWRSALTQVGNLSRWHLQESRSKAELIKHIVYTISKSLKPTFSKVAEDLVGIKSRLEEINDLFGSGLDDIRFIGICGISGIGRTIIAKVLYERFSGDYQGSCSLDNVGKVSRQKGVVHLQEILLSKVLNGISLNICNPDEGIYYIRWRLRRKRVFVVLDDVDGLEQLEKLAGKDNWFGSGSRIIITTRDKHVLISYGMSSIYEVKGLKDDDALQPFYMKAFRQGQPTDDQVEQSKQIVRYTNGLPLALRVLGAHPSGRTVEEWKSELKRRPAERSEAESIEHIAANSLKPSFSEVVAKPSISEVVVDLFRDVIELIFDKIRSEYTDSVEEPDSEEEDSDEEPDSKEEDSDEEQIQKKKTRRQ